MRYRAFGRNGAAASALSLALTDEPMRDTARLKLIYAALEAGINTFELRTPAPDVVAALDEATASIERPMLIIGLRVGWSLDRRGDRKRDLEPGAVANAMEDVLARTRFGHLDVAVLDIFEDERLPPHVIPDLHNARDAGRVRTLAVAGGETADPYIGRTDFDALVTPFHIRSGWAERNRLRRAVQADMPVVGCNYHPPGLGGAPPETSAPARRGLAAFLSPPKPSPRLVSAYDFLRAAHGWTPEQVCLAFALTEPCLATIQTTETDPDALTALAGFVERDLPNGLAAQIEMARISDERTTDALANRRSGA